MISSMVDDPSALSEGDVLLVDKITYLGIREDDDKLTYFTSYEPQRIPQGIRARPVGTETKCIGLRQFKVYKEDAETYDIVYVGTIMVVDGTAWIVGDTIYNEEPDFNDDDRDIILPPMAITYPVNKPGNMTHLEFKFKYRNTLKAQLYEKLKYEMENAGYDTNEYDFESKPSFSDEVEPRNIFPNRCPMCSDYVVKFHDGLCAKCADSSSINQQMVTHRDSSFNQQMVAHKDCGGEVETHDKNLDCGGCSNLATEQLSSSFRSRALIN